MLYSLDLRIRVINAVKSGSSKVEICKVFNICRQTIYNWINLELKQGNLLPIKSSKTGHPRGIKDDQKFKKYVDKHSDSTQKEIALFFNVGLATVSRTLKRIGYTRKKSQTYSERDESQRQKYFCTISTIKKDKIIYLDESGMNDNDFYPYAYTEVGKRHYESHPGHYNKRISMIAGLNNKNILAPFMFEGHCNTKLFEEYIEQKLSPALKPDMIIIMDNASFHKSLKIRQLIESKGCKLIFLPPYSSDLNPIEHYWYKIKNDIRKGMRNNKMKLAEAMNSVLTRLSTC